MSIMCNSAYPLHADDIAFYQIINSAADYVQLQTDIDSISRTSFISGKHLKEVKADACFPWQGRQFIHFNYTHR